MSPLLLLRCRLARFYLFVVFSFHFHYDGRKCEGITRDLDIARTLEDWPTAAFIHKNSITCHDWCVKFFFFSVRRKKNQVRRSARWKTLVRFHPPLRPIYSRTRHIFFVQQAYMSSSFVFVLFFFYNNEKRVAAFSFFYFVLCVRVINLIASYVGVATHFEKCFSCCCGEFF